MLNKLPEDKIKISQNFSPQRPGYFSIFDKELPNSSNRPSPLPSKPVATPIPPPAIPPNMGSPEITFISTSGIKQASPDIIVFDDPIDPEFLTQAFFQEFGGTELINISRSDLVDGNDVSYSPIINLSNVKKDFNPNNIIAVGAFQENPTKYGIDLFSRGVVEPYFDSNGNLVIEVDQIRSDESIEVEVAFDGTINRIEL